MNQFALLLRHAASFARDHGLPFDADLMSVVLHRREHDDVSPTYWPTATLDEAHCTDSVEATGACAEDIGRTVATFLEFLRTTGRLESASRDNHPAGMGRRVPARRLRPRGPRHGAVPDANPLAAGPLMSGPTTSGSTTRSLPEFRGTTLMRPDSSHLRPPSATPRSRRNGGGIDRQCPRPDVDTTGQLSKTAVTDSKVLGRQPELAALQGSGGADPRWEQATQGLPTRMRTGPWLQDDAGIDHAKIAVAQPKVAEVAKQVRASRYVADSLALAQWVGSGRATTASDHLLPQLGQQAYVAVKLDRHDQAREAWLGQTWRNSADCHALNRLWWPLIDAGLLNITGGQAVSQLPPPAGPYGNWSDGQLVDFAHALYVSLLRTLSVPARQIIVGTLFAGLVSQHHTAHRDEVANWFAQLNSLDSHLPQFSFDDVDWQTCARRCVDLTLPEMHDFGAWQVQGPTIHLGPLGVDLAQTTSGYLDAGVVTITAS